MGLAGRGGRDETGNISTGSPHFEEFMAMMKSG